jgi:hypothetical protein
VYPHNNEETFWQRRHYRFHATDTLKLEQHMSLSFASFVITTNITIIGLTGLSGLVRLTTGLDPGSARGD